MNKPKKVLLVGWDAADWKVIHNLMDEGRMPTVQRLVENGTMGNLATLFPALSPMLWTSIATGKRPYKHGIYGFTEPTPNNLGVQPMTIMSRKCKAIWNILNQHEKKSLVVGWWPSHPAEPIDGVMISDFYHKAPRKPTDPFKMMKGCISPESLAPVFDKMRMHPTMLKPQHILPYVPRAPEIDQDKDGRLSALMKIICECTTIHRAASTLLQTQEWDFAAVYYDAIDHYSHAFMKYHPPRRPHIAEDDYEFYKGVVTQGYIYHDIMLKSLLEAAGDDVTVILMSDHGFHPDHLRPRVIPTEPAGPAVEHRDLGIFVACGDGIKKDHVVDGANLLDITPTILSLYGLPYGEDMDGRPLTDIFEDDIETSQIPSWEDVPGDDGSHPDDAQLDPAESKETMEQLIALGYIERPDKDASAAVAKCQCELDYNLARAYMDADLFGEAIPLLEKLYNEFPLEFRFGLQLSNCLNAMDRKEELETLVEDLNQRWRVARNAAKKKLREFAKVFKERKQQFRELQKIDKQNEEEGRNIPKLAQVDVRGKPIMFSPTEYHAIRKIRAVSRGNPQILDFLSAIIAASKGEFEKAIEIMDDEKFVVSTNPMFHYQRGNFYLGLKRLDDAEKSYLRALEIDELDSQALVGLCRTHLEAGKAAKAIDFGQQAVGLKYHNPLGHYYLAEAKYLTGDVESSVVSYQTAIQQNPNFAEAHEKLAEIYTQKLTDPISAKQHQQSAEALKDDISEYQDTVEKIVLVPTDSLEFEKLLPKVDTENSEEFVRCLGQAKPMMEKLEKKSEASQSAPIVIVSGLPRSGTSMMMQMLSAGGMTAYVDENRQPDESNPRGYFESEKVKKLAYLNNWVAECEGKVLKVVAPMMTYLPQNLNYQVVFMNRNIDEIVESQEKMLERLDRTGGDLTNEKFVELFKSQIFNCKNLIQLHDVACLNVQYSEAINNPASVASKVKEFLDFDLDLAAMQSAVDPALYRQKKN